MPPRGAAVQTCLPRVCVLVQHTVHAGYQAIHWDYWGNEGAVSDQSCRIVQASGNVQNLTRSYVCLYVHACGDILSCIPPILVHRSGSFNESEQVPGYQDFVTPGQPGSGKLKRKLPVVRKQRTESSDQGEPLFHRQHTLCRVCAPNLWSLLLTG